MTAIRDTRGPHHIAAQKINRERNQLRREIRRLPIMESRALAADVIREQAECVRNVRVFDLFCWTRGSTANDQRKEDRMLDLLERVGIRFTRTVGTLTLRQADELAFRLQGQQRPPRPSAPTRTRQPKTVRP